MPAASLFLSNLSPSNYVTFTGVASLFSFVFLVSLKILTQV